MRLRLKTGEMSNLLDLEVKQHSHATIRSKVVNV